jgi:hypothetical protein
MTTLELLRARLTLNNIITEQTLIAASVDHFHDLHGLTIANTGAAATVVTIRDATGGAGQYIIPLAAGDKFGWRVPWDSGTKQSAKNNNWTAQASVATISVEITAEYHKRL